MSLLLPVHGFVLAGGRSSRMGTDKATLPFIGRPMIEIAVEKLRSVCADVSIAGNREDLGHVGEIVLETRVDAGPAAGIEAGLLAARQAWALFIPVDVPLVPVGVLRELAAAMKPTYLSTDGVAQPTFCLLPNLAIATWSQHLDKNRGRLLRLLEAVDARPLEVGRSNDFVNVNTPEELLHAERLADTSSRAPAVSQKA